MFTVEFYETADGQSDVRDFFEDLRINRETSKDAHIQFKQLAMYIDLLAQNGTMLPDNITKHIGDGIWELRPGNNRVFYFYYQDDCFVLLHHFRKKSQKTPQREIDRAKAERADHLKRKEQIK